MILLPSTSEMDAKGYFGTSVGFYQTTRRHIPVGSNLQPWFIPAPPAPLAQQLKWSLGRLAVVEVSRSHTDTNVRLDSTERTSFHEQTVIQ